MHESEPSITTITVGDVTVTFESLRSENDGTEDEVFDFRDRSLHSELSGVDADLRTAWDEQKSRQDATLAPKEKELDLDGWFREDLQKT